MSRFPLDVDRYMSTVVVVIDPSQPLSEAIRLMRLHEVRHLPVVRKGKIAGLLSQRDVYLMQSIEDSDPSGIAVSEAMTRDPYTVDPEAPIDRVAREMARRKVGSVLVAHDGRLLGLFTSTDALLALAALVADDRVPGEAEGAEGEALREIVPARRTRASAKRRGARARSTR